MEQTAIFEDKRWSKGAQPMVFRHKAALEFVKPGMSLLDVACGDGLFLSLASEKGANVAGVDISDQGISNAKDRGIERVLKCDVTSETLPFADDEFDMVTAMDVLEHLLEPERLLKEIRRVTKQSAVITVPNFSALPCRWQCLLGKVPENSRPKKGHVYWFNHQILKNMLDAEGWDMVEAKTNHQGSAIPVARNIMAYLAKVFPNIFALSFVVLIRKKNSG